MKKNHILNIFEMRMPYILPLISMAFLPFLSSCNSNSLENPSRLPNIREAIKGEKVSLIRIDLRKNDTMYYFNQESFQNESISIYKYQLRSNSNKYLYSYNDKNSFSFDYETNSYLVYGMIDGVFDSYLCTYVGEIGQLSSLCNINLYEESNFVEIEIENKKNISLNSNDYNTIVNNELNQKGNEKEDLIQTLNHQCNQLSLCATYTLYIDLNCFDSYEYTPFEYNGVITKNVKKQKRTSSYSASYFSCIDKRKVTYIIGGKNNVLEVSKFTNGSDEKYLPLSTTINSIIIENESYENSTEYLGEVIVEVYPSLNYEKSICNHIESNYNNLSMSEDNYSKFINQNSIEYSIDNNDYYINTKKSVSYSENVGEYGAFIFINVQNY